MELKEFFDNVMKILSFGYIQRKLLEKGFKVEIIFFCFKCLIYFNIIVLKVDFFKLNCSLLKEMYSIFEQIVMYFDYFMLEKFKSGYVIVVILYYFSFLIKI